MKYAEEANYLAGYTLGIISEAHRELRDKLDAVIEKMGILSCISCLFSLISIPSSVLNLIEHIQLRDAEGIALSAATLFRTPVECLDSLSSFMVALTALGAIPMIAFFGMVAFPLAIGLTAYDLLRGLYELVRSSIEYHSMPKTADLDRLRELSSYLDKKLGITAPELADLEEKYAALKNAPAKHQEKIAEDVQILKDRKRNQIIRRTDEKIYALMCRLQEHLKNNPQDVAGANTTLKQMNTRMIQKISFNSVECALNAAYLTTLALAVLMPVSAIAVPIVGAIRSSFTIGQHLYTHLT